MRVLTAWLAAAALLITAWTAQPEACRRICPSATAALAHRGGTAQESFSRQALEPGGHRCTVRRRTDGGAPPVTAQGPAAIPPHGGPCPGCGPLQTMVGRGTCWASATAAVTLARHTSGGARPAFPSTGADRATALRRAAEPVAVLPSGRLLPPFQPALYLLFATLLI